MSNNAWLLFRLVKLSMKHVRHPMQMNYVFFLKRKCGFVCTSAFVRKHKMTRKHSQLRGVYKYNSVCWRVNTARINF